MYYVFMETGDDVFFQKIIRAFCSEVVKSIFELDANKTLNQANNSEMLENKNMTNFFNKDGRTLYFLNCYLFPSTSACVNDKCKKERKVVLTNEQVASISNSIHEAVKTEKMLKNYKERPGRERVNIDNVFQNYETKIMSKIIPLNLGVKSARKNKNDYLNAYIRRSNALLNKNNVEGFAYIRSGTNESDFDYFKNHTKLPDVMFCDNYQGI